MALQGRRVVTGLDAAGKSCVVSNMTIAQIAGDGTAPMVLWRTTDLPVSNAGNDDSAVRFEPEMFDSSSSMCIMMRAEPGTPAIWHATNTIDYVVLLSGRIRIELETGGVDLDPGDVVVDRGVLHNWHVLGDEPAVMLATLIRAEPVGAGTYLDANFMQRFAE